MGFIERELSAVSDALLAQPEANDYPELYAIQQALLWALDPSGFKAPMRVLRGTQVVTEDCPECLDPDQF